MDERRRAWVPFVVTGGAAIIAGGLVAAAVARQPVQVLVWMSAYLVLVVGVAQIAFGAGQAALAARVPSVRWIAGEWLVFNLGNAGVITGALRGSFAMVCAGTLLFATAIALFLWHARGGSRRGWLLAYRILLALIFASSLVGLGLSVVLRLR